LNEGVDLDAKTLQRRGSHRNIPEPVQAANRELSPAGGEALITTSFEHSPVQYPPQASAAFRTHLVMPPVSMGGGEDAR